MVLVASIAVSSADWYLQICIILYSVDTALIPSMHLKVCTFIHIFIDIQYSKNCNFVINECNLISFTNKYSKK